MARIDIEPGDRFVAASGLFQLRGDKERYVSWNNVDTWSNRLECGERPVSRDTAIAAIRLMGHEVVEVATGYAPVRITHGVESECGLIAYLGTKEACEKYSKAYGGYRVVPVTF